MPTREIKTRLKIEGDTQYQSAIKKINSELSTLRSEMKVVDAQFAGNAKSMEALEARSEALNKQYDKQREKLETLRNALKNAQNAQESANSKVEECRDKYNRAQQELEAYKQSTDKTAEGQKQLEDAVAQAGKELEIAERAQKSAASAVEDYGRKSNQTQAEVYKLERELENTNQDLMQARSEAQRVGSAIEDLGNEMQDSAQKGQNFGEKSKEGVDTLAAALTANGIKESLEAVTKAINDCLDASVQFESAITGVYKTVDGTSAQLQRITDGVKEMSTEIPATTTEIAGVAEAAGQLGIATEDVIDFTRVMIDLGESTNLSADEAASALAKFANITGTAASDYSRLGSVIVGLGNNFATTEADIVAMATRLASAGTLAGLTEAEIMGLATAMSSVGIEAEAGGTAMTQTLSAIEKAVAESGDSLDEFARIAGVSSEEFASKWENNAVEALQLFIAGLGNLDAQGESATIVLDEMGLSGVRQSNMLKSLALAADTLTGAVELANVSWEENTALTEEAGKRYETTESKIAMARNAFDNLKVAIGDQLNPALEAAAEAGANAFTWATDFVENNSWVVGAITGVTTAIGLLGVGVAGYTVATNIAIPATQAFTSALLANPVGQVAVALTAVVSAVSGFTVALTNAELPENRFKENLIKARQATDELEISIENLNQTISENEFNIDQVKVYIEELERLEERGLENIGVNQLYQKTLKELQELMPELAVTIDETTGAVEGGTEALLLQAEAWAEQENAAEALSILEDAKNAYEETKLAVEENTAAMEPYLEEQAALAEQLDYTNSKIEYGSEQWNDMYDRISELEAVIIPEFMAQDEALREELQLQAEKVVEAQAAYDQYNQTVASGNESATETLAVLEGFSGKIDSIQGDLQALQEEYEEAYNSAYTNISGQFGLFETMDTVVATSVGDMIASLQSQSAYMDEYATNMRLAAKYGVDEGLIAELSDGSVESAAILKGIAEDGGENVDKLNANFKRVEEGKKAFSSKIASMATDFDDRMSEITSRMDDMVSELDQYNEAAKSADNTVQGALDALYSRMDDMYNAGYALARAEARGFAAGSEQASPSKVFKRLQHNNTLGILVQAKADTESVRQSSKQLAEASIDGYQSKMVELQYNYTRALGTMDRLSEQSYFSNSTVNNNSNRVEVHNHYTSPTQTSYAELERMKRRERREIVRRLMPK